MIRFTPQAADEIRRVAQRTDSEGMFLRIAASAGDGGALVHAMGFDERREGDLMFSWADIAYVVSQQHRPLLEGTLLDFVTLNTGSGRFVFDNPNDLGCAAALGPCGACNERCRSPRSAPAFAVA
ncbi:MAG TPA: hypothetical protein VF801_02775 [Rhodocyclaceae bacterium]